MAEANRRLAGWMKLHMEKRQLSQNRLAKATGISLTTINRYCDPAYDAMVKEMAATADLAKRSELAKKMNGMLTKDTMTVVPLVDRGRLSAASVTLGGVVLNTWDTEMWNAQDWFRVK